MKSQSYWCQWGINPTRIWIGSVFIFQRSSEVDCWLVAVLRFLRSNVSLMETISDTVKLWYRLWESTAGFALRYQQSHSHERYLFVFPDTSENAVLSLSFPPVSVFNDGSRTGDKSANIGFARRGASTWIFTPRASWPFSRLHLHHLKELREEGMIEVLDEPEGKKVYGLTKSGVYLLKALTGVSLSEPSTEHPVEFEVLVWCYYWCLPSSEVWAWVPVRILWTYHQSRF